MIAVIGGGAAGMMAAIAAAQRGADVTLIEQNKICGKKLLITGKGRCNITNACPTEDIFRNIPTNPRFLYSAVYAFSNYDTVDFFVQSGVPTKVERGERVFPQSDRAASVADALVRKMRLLGVTILHGKADKILTDGERVTGVSAGGKTVAANAVILATGGKSYPRTGSDGFGYGIAEKLGHSITKLRPALVPVETFEDTKPIMGLSLKNVTLTVTDRSGSKLHSELGELLFTHFGLSGPLVLSASSHMGSEPEKTILEIDLKPALSEQKLEQRILRDFSKYINKDFRNALSDLLPQRLIDTVIARSEIDPFKKVNSVTREERRRLVNVIKRMSFTVRRYRPIEEAIVTSGGVSVREINPKTMESKIVGGLYFAGEIIDVDAYTGGFNLQIAFSTGHLAGESAAEGELENDKNSD